MQRSHLHSVFLQHFLITILMVQPTNAVHIVDPFWLSLGFIQFVYTKLQYGRSYGSISSFQSVPGNTLETSSLYLPHASFPTASLMAIVLDIHFHPPHVSFGLTSYHFFVFVACVMFGSSLSSSLPVHFPVCSF